MRDRFTCTRCSTLVAVIRPRQVLRIIAGELVGGSLRTRHFRIRCGCGQETRIDLPDRVEDWLMERDLAA